MSNEKSVYKCLDASAAHVPPDERERMIGVFNVSEYEEGWWLWVHPAEDLPDDAENFPAVLALLAVARDLGCRWVNLDVDGDVLEGLPTYADDPCEVEGCESYPADGNARCAVHLPMMRCRYEDCVEQHPVASDSELVTCAKCREYLGLPKLCVKCSRPIPVPVLDALEPERCVNCADPK